MLLQNKVILVSGGAGLLGQAFIKAIAAEGGVAVIADVNEASGLDLHDRIDREYPNHVDFVRFDMLDKDSIASAIAYISHRHGRIDALVNNAYPRNAQYGRRMMDVEYGDFCENMNLHLGGYFLASQQMAAYFVRQGHGNIVNMASIYGVVAPDFSIYNNTTMTMPVEYAVIKAGLIHLTKYMAKFFAGQRIRVNALSPGGIFDDQPDSFVNAYRQVCLNKGMLDKTDLVGSLLYLLSDLSLCVNGQNLIVDDGFTV